MHSMNHGYLSRRSMFRGGSNSSEPTSMQFKSSTPSTTMQRSPAMEPHPRGIRPAASLVEQQAKIERDLETFRMETLPNQAGLSAEIRLVLNHVHQHLFDLNLNVEQVKLSCRIRDNNVSSRFRHAMGLTIKAYIEALRMQAAERLLRRRKIGVFDVAQFVGYNHLQTFYRAFQRRFGCPPATYRRRHLAQPAS